MYAIYVFCLNLADCGWRCSVLSSLFPSLPVVRAQRGGEGPTDSQMCMLWCGWDRNGVWVGGGAAGGSNQSHESGLAAQPNCLAAGRHNYTLTLMQAGRRGERIGLHKCPSFCSTHTAEDMIAVYKTGKSLAVRLLSAATYCSCTVFIS